MKPDAQSKPLAEVTGRKATNLDRLAQRVAEEPGLLPELLAGLGADEPRIKYGCSKVLRMVSEKHPAVLYPRFDFFAGLLDADNNFLKWDAGRVIANLAAVDSEGKLEPILARYLRPIAGPAMITAANLIQNAATIAMARPAWAGRLARAVLKVERAEYQTAECRNVAIGHAIESFSRFIHLLPAGEKAAVVKFVRRQVDNRRNAVRKKAAAFLKLHDTSAGKKDQPTPPNAFVGKTQPPTDAELAAALGGAKALWDRLLGDLAGKFKLTVQEWNSYSPKAGWALRLKADGRNIFYLAPRRGSFLASFALGDKALAAARQGGLSPSVVKIINEARRYAEGTAVRLNINAAKDLAAVNQLAGIKLAN